MIDRSPPDIATLVDELYRVESRRVLATLIRLLGDFDQAEDAMQEAFSVALRQWPADGVPANPRAWLISTGRFKAIDAYRRRARFDATLPDLARAADLLADEDVDDDPSIEDDRLRLIFTCCHPALNQEARIALTLREVCGLTTEEVAHAFLVSTPTLAQRIVRAKAKIKNAGIPYRVPSEAELPERLDTVWKVVYLVYNEGYAATSGDRLTRVDLSTEAIRLARLLSDLLPHPETDALLALMLLHESRRPARTTAEGDLVLLEDQDRTLWDRAMIAEGLQRLERARASGQNGAYLLQASIAAEHATSEHPGETNWARIVALYDALLGLHPSPIVELNRAVAIAMLEGPERGLELVTPLLERPELSGYHLAFAAHADLHRRLGQVDAARVSYQRALSLARLEPERRFLSMRLESLAACSDDRPGRREANDP